MPTGITQTLLCACRRAYDIQFAGLLPADLTSDDATIGWCPVAPNAFVNGIDRIDAGYVGETDDAVIVVLRGTLPPSSPDRGQMVLDWLSDCDAALVNAQPDFPGLVHQGFLDAVNIL